MCHERGLPVMLKGPTGCGKTRFVEHMAWRLQRPLVTIACHDDLSASDLTGRYLIRGGETVWVDGPLTVAARAGAICYLDEIVEARQDTVVVIHPLTDDRRLLPIERDGRADRGGAGIPGRHLVQPGLPARDQGPQAEHAPAVRRARLRFPAADVEATIVAHESGVDATTADALVQARAARPPAPRSGARRGTEHAASRIDGAAHRGRNPAASGVSRGARRAAHRRSRSRGRDHGHHRRDALIVSGRAGFLRGAREPRCDGDRGTRRCAAIAARSCAHARARSCAWTTSGDGSSCS